MGPRILSSQRRPLCETSANVAAASIESKGVGDLASEFDSDVLGSLEPAPFVQTSRELDAVDTVYSKESAAVESLSLPQAQGSSDSRQEEVELSGAILPTTFSRGMPQTGVAAADIHVSSWHTFKAWMAPRRRSSLASGCGVSVTPLKKCGSRPVAGTIAAPSNAFGDNTTSILRQTPLDALAGGRAILLAIPATASLNAVLAQVCGGPLERVAVTTRPVNGVVIEFVHRVHALRFYQYVRRERLVVSGQTIRGTYAPADLATDPLTLLPPTAVDLMGISNVDVRVRRTIKVFRRVNPMESSDFRRVISGIDAAYLRRAFGRLGTVLQVQPMFFRHHIAFAVHYDSITAAMRAKSSFEASASNNHLFGPLAGWRVDWLKDPTERPCLIL